MADDPTADIVRQLKRPDDLLVNAVDPTARVNPAILGDLGLSTPTPRPGPYRKPADPAVDSFIERFGIWSPADLLKAREQQRPPANYARPTARAGGGGIADLYQSQPPLQQQQADVVSAAQLQAENERLGRIMPGNIDLNSRPVVKNPDGTISTVKSMSIGTPEGQVLIPMVSADGRILSPDDAIAEFRRTGAHLGIFASPQAADAYARQLHQQQDQRYSPAPAPR